MEAETALIILNMLDHVGSVRLKKLVDHFGDPVSILSATRMQLQSIPGIGSETAQAILSWEKKVDWKNELKRIRDFHCNIVTWSDKTYPHWLLQIPDPPPVLYVLGHLDIWSRNSIAIVGSRQSTDYGRRMAFRFGKHVAALGLAVISGGARGIDTEAHKGSLAAKGRTVAVLGTGINRVFPPENKGLFDEIRENGAVITQFPFNQCGHKQSFPIRNRIVAGMTLGTLVIEAPKQSGALITAHMAADFGRQVFALPGPADAESSAGCHELIRNGARLCDSIRDILEELEYMLPKSMKVPDNKVEVQNPLNSVLKSGLDPEETQIINLIETTPVHLDWLIQKSGLPSARVVSTLFKLELKKRVSQLPGKNFRLFIP